VLDRSELERQIYDTFTAVGAVPVTKNKDNVAQSREDLRKLLQENQRYVFTLIHKFSIDPKLETEYPLITDRKNVIVISDEAHRTQSGTFARNMRFNGIPNASYLGFTGTPLIDEEKEITKNIFGEYVSIYDFKRSIEDGATLPLRYLNRGEKLGIENPKLDEEMVEILQNEDLDDDQKRKLTYLFQNNYVILTSEKRLDDIAKDLVWHFNERGYQGKGMFVALDKPTAVRMYDLIMKHWVAYVADLKKRINKASDVEEEQQLKRKLSKVIETEVCVVVSSEQNEVDKFRKLGLDIATHRKKMVERDLEKEFKEDENPFRLAIVCAMWITGFDAPCVSTVYLDKPIKGHTLMQTIARANRVYDDEKENGLIIDYGNVYKQLEKAFSVYGEGGSKGVDPNGENGGITRPVELLEDDVKGLGDSIDNTKSYLKELSFNLDELTSPSLKPMEKLGCIKKAVDCVCLNENTRTKYEVMAREVFRKYMALYPQDVIKPYIKSFNAIEAIYQQLNQQTKDADVIEIIKRLQQVVNDNVVLQENTTTDPKQEVYVDLSKLDFDKLRKVFAGTPKKNTVLFDLQRAVDKKMKQMLKDNPMRMEFYKRYEEIIEEYNRGKDLDDTMKSFDKLFKFVQELNEEDTRALRENLDEESLAIFDLLKKDKSLTTEELKEVKKISVDTLSKLKDEKLKIDRWRESMQITAQIKTVIFDCFQWLPQNTYTDTDVAEKTMSVYQHIYSNYGGIRMAASA
jgi:type I restriction enzyme R subunit